MGKTVMGVRPDAGVRFQCTRAGILVLLLVLGLSTQGCTLAPHVAAPDTPDKLPQEYGVNSAEEDGGAVNADRTVDAATSTDAATVNDAAPFWWRSYNDPVLNAMVDSSITRNLDLHVAIARVLEVQQLHKVTRAGMFPSLQAGVNGDRQSIPTNSGVTGRFSENIPSFPSRFDFTTYSATLGLSYEFDFWGKARAGARAAMSEFIATAADFQAVRQGVISETIATYFEVRDLGDQLALARLNEDLLEERVEITENRYRRGLTTSFELYAVRQALNDLRAGTPLINSRQQEALGRLAVLQGSIPADIESVLNGTVAPDFSMEPIPPGLPSDLITNRPDIASAAARLEAARQGIGVARAARLPSLSLTASGGTQSNDLASLVKSGQGLGILAGSLITPLFRAGALKAGVKASWARYRQAEAAYSKVVLTAFKDVSAALVEHDAEWRRLQYIQNSLDDAEESSSLQLRRYRSGIGDYLALIDARINSVRARLNLAAAEHAAAVARLGVHRALGGHWLDERSTSAGGDGIRRESTE